MIKKYFFHLSIIGLLAAGCAGNKNIVQEAALKDVFKDDFTIGTALSLNQILGKDKDALVVTEKHFNVVTPENSMKSMYMQPKWGEFHFADADKLVEYAKDKNLQVVAHALIWHSQLPDYVNNIKSKDSLQTFFTNHINTVAARYEGKVYAWDVVNEAVEEDGSMRKSIFYNLLGEDYVVKAFELAQKATPSSKLYYNDYNIEQPAKRAGTIALIKKIQEAGVRIDGVGIQGHWHVGKIPLKEIEESILEYAALGLEVMITELDVEVLPRNFSGAEISKKMESDPSLNPYTESLPDSVQQQLANDYAALFNLFLKHKDKISRITFWGVNDAQSWLNDWPAEGRTNHPLLFDRNNKPKPAFYKVVETKGNITESKKAF